MDIPSYPRRSRPRRGLFEVFPWIYSMPSIAALLSMSDKLPFYEYLDPYLSQIDFGSITGILMLWTALWAAYNYISQKFGELIRDYYACTVILNSDDQLYQDLISWLEQRGESGIEDANVRYATRVWEDQLENVPPSPNIILQQSRSTRRYGRRAPPPLPIRALAKHVKYNPAPGVHHIYYNDQLVKITRSELPHEPNISPVRLKSISLETRGRSWDTLTTLLDEVIEYVKLKEGTQTMVWRPAHWGGNWDRALSRPSRALSTVVLEDEQKDKLLQDVNEYLLPETARWYANRGLPYRRGYLLYGPPGTGKTSLTLALGGHFNLQVYALSLASGNIGDDGLEDLMNQVPPKCVVVIEDVDACKLERAKPLDMPETRRIQPDRFGIPHDPRGPPRGGGVTLSGLLNAIDGVTAKEGRILIMTTNHRELLDEALIRPGRIDLQIRFSNASKKVARNLFENIYNVSESDQVALGMPANFPDAKERSELAEKFADKIPDGKFSPAEVQGHLLTWKKEPRVAVERVEGWVKDMERIREEKRKQKLSNLEEEESKPEEEGEDVEDGI